MIDPRDGRTSEKKVLANQNNEMVHIRQLPSWVMECCVVQCTGEILSSVQNWEKISIYLFVKFCNSGGAQYTALTPQRPISSPQGATALQHSQCHHHSCHYLHNVFHPPRMNRILYFCDFNVLWDGWGVLKTTTITPTIISDAMCIGFCRISFWQCHKSDFYERLKVQLRRSTIF